MKVDKDKLAAFTFADMMDAIDIITVAVRKNKDNPEFVLRMETARLVILEEMERRPSKELVDGFMEYLDLLEKVGGEVEAVKTSR